MRGRKPTPVALHKLRGTYRGDRHGKALAVESGLKSLGGEAPAWLPETAQALYRQTVADVPHGLLKEIDRALLCAYVLACDEHATAARMLRKVEPGSKEARLYGRILGQSANRVIRIAREFGFTPTSRFSGRVE